MDVDLEEAVRREEGTDPVAVDPEGRHEGTEDHRALLEEQSGNLAHPTDVLGPVAV